MKTFLLIIVFLLTCFSLGLAEKKTCTFQQVSDCYKVIKQHIGKESICREYRITRALICMEDLRRYGGDCPVQDRIDSLRIEKRLCNNGFYRNTTSATQRCMMRYNEDCNTYDAISCLRKVFNSGDTKALEEERVARNQMEFEYIMCKARQYAGQYTCWLNEVKACKDEYERVKKSVTMTNYKNRVRVCGLAKSAKKCLDKLSSKCETEMPSKYTADLDKSLESCP